MIGIMEDACLYQYNEWIEYVVPLRWLGKNGQGSELYIYCFFVFTTRLLVLLRQIDNIYDTSGVRRWLD